MSAQFLPLHFKQNEEWAHMQGLKLSNTIISRVMIMTVPDLTEAFIELDIREEKEREPLAIRTSFA